MRRVLLLFGTLSFALPAHAVVSIDWVPIGDPGNAADFPFTNCERQDGFCGVVSYNYYISKYDITNAQYAEFLNAKAVTDPFGLYESQMGADASNGGNPQRDDGIDNDGNGLVDFADPKCSAAWPYWENSPIPAECGLGAELSIAVPLLTWLHNRRRRRLTA